MSLDTYHPIHHIWFYLVVVGILEALAVYIWQFRRILGAKPLGYCQLCKCIWLLGLVIASVSPMLPQKLFWISLEQIMEVLFPFFWLLLITELSRGDQKIPRVLNNIFGVIVAISCLAILTNHWTGLFWRKVWLDGPVMTGIKGPLFQIAFVSSYLLNAINYGLTIRWFFKTKGLRRRQALLFMIMPLFSWAGHMVSLIPGAYLFEPQPTGFLFAGIYITWFFYRWRVISILPRAQETVVRDMIDGLLIVDQEDYIVDLNPAAEVIFQGMPAAVGGKFPTLAAAWPHLAQLGGIPEMQSIEAVRDYPEGTRWFQLNVTNLNSTGGRLLGKVIVLKDITQQKLDQAQLLEQQKTLSVLTERDRLGREIHDGQGQIWSYLKVELQTLRILLKSDQVSAAQEQVDQLIEITKEVHDDVRESITGLKSAASPDREFSATLRDYLDWYGKNYGITTALDLPKESLVTILNRRSEVQLLRIIQEALTNIRKHAKAHRVTVAIAKTDGEAIVKIVDDGCGFDITAIPPDQKSYGLQIMKERAEEVGGRLEIKSKPNAGTSVTVRFKLEKGGDGS